MARREDFDNSLWSDPDFLALSPQARYTYIWTWTNQRCGMAGIYKLSPAAAALELGLDQDAVIAALAELGEAKYAFYEGNVLWVRSRVKHLRQKTVQIAKAIRSDLALIPQGHPLKEQFIQTYVKLSWLSVALSGDPLEGPMDPIHPKDGPVTVNGGGTGKGTGGKGWGSGKGNKSAAAKPYSPDPEAIALRDAHFPDEAVQAVESCAITLRFRRQDVTPEAVRALLYGESGEGLRSTGEAA